jgi:hypothetical protein
MKNFKLLFLFVFFFSSCNSVCELVYGEKNLGRRFTLVEDDKDDISIIYCTSSPGSCCNVGIPIVPSKVLKYNIDQDWIIAKSSKDGYYIIDKSFDVKSGVDEWDFVLKHVFGPFDKDRFENEKQKRNITLTFGSPQ